MTRDDIETALIQVRRALQAQAITLLGHTLGSVSPALLVAVYWPILGAIATVDPAARDLLYRLAREYCDQRETGKPALSASDVLGASNTPGNARSASEESV